MIKDIGIDIRKHQISDFAIDSPCYQNESDQFAQLGIWANYGMLFINGIDKKPIYFMRHCNKEKYRWGGIIELGDGPLSPQKSLHHKDIAQGDTLTDYYGVTNNNPLTYGSGSKDPFSEYRFNNDYATWKEGDFLNLKAEYFPYACVSHKNSPQKFCFYHQFVTLSGTYEGKEVVGMGGFDRSYFPTIGNMEDYAAEAMTYLGAVYSCIREDGRKESANMCIYDRNGYGYGYYYLEGEEPIVTDEIYLDAKWYHLPYAQNDPTVCFKDATWYFGGKEIHFTGLWGAKGYTATPRLEKIGQSHVYGTWYEGKQPYKQKLFYTWNENMKATEKEIRRMGWEVVDGNI
ncbi:MAG: hypothetical protein Q4C64_02195 [Erysipelotrichia bacterium]|nr:hypothetical protein [Erysipelotrichia bacterium]